MTDKEGLSSDTFQMELNDGPPQFLAIPGEGAIVDIRIGYGAARSLGTYVIDKVSPKCLPYSMSISGKARDMRDSKAKERKERHWDKKKVKEIASDLAGDNAKRIEVEADGDSVYRVAEPYADAAEADKAAQSRAKELKRGEGTASVTVIGDTAIVAGAPLLFEGVRPGLVGVPYIIDTATHSSSKGEGYRTAISAKLYDGKSGGSKSGKDGAANDNTPNADKVADNAPDGTLATPTEWTNTRLYGRTDENWRYSRLSLVGGRRSAGLQILPSALPIASYGNDALAKGCNRRVWTVNSMAEPYPGEMLASPSP